MTKQELMDKIRPILEKGKPINDIIFISKKMTYYDIVYGLWFCRPIGHNPVRNFLGLRKKIKDDNYTGMSDEFINNMLLETEMWGGDYFCQLFFGCIAALDVYTEEEILTVLDVQRKFTEGYYDDD